MKDLIGAAEKAGAKRSSATTLKEMSKDFERLFKTPIVAAKVDHVLKDLQTPAGEFESVAFVDMTEEAGIKVYQRSIVFLLITAVHELYEGAELTVEHSIGKGLYCELYLGRALSARDVEAIERRMREIVAENREILKKNLPREEAAALFEKTGQAEKANLIRLLERAMVSVYYCGDFYDYLYGPMVSSTGDLGLFALDYIEPGIVVRTPDADDPSHVPAFVAQPKLAKVFAEAEQWARILDCNYVTNLNNHLKKGEIGDLIRVSEALHEKKIAQIADYIAGNIENIRLILIAGPSSSGKTTFAQRMRVQLRVNAIAPVSISLDDYFLDRAHTPRNEKGEYDFESLDALDVELFNAHLIALFAGKSVEVPCYNFVTGEREYCGKVVRLEKNQPVIVEGIHGLNEKLTRSIERKAKYKIYISALTQLAIDGHNRIPTTDTRLIRRMVRDYNFRGSNALRTLKQWPSVRAGEEKNIFPYQEEADAMFNSALIYELGILKKYAKPLLEAVDRRNEEYMEAARLLDFLAYFDDIDAEDEVPINSILKEFIGRSCFFEKGASAN